MQVGAPLDRIGTDLLGPLPLTPRGNKHILVIQDYFMKWVKIFAEPDATGNGMVERFNQTRIKMIRSFIDGKQNDWDLNLGCLAGAYRSAVYESTGFTPNMNARKRIKDPC